MENNNKHETPEAKEALIDGLSFICQKLYMYFDGKKTNLMPVSQLLVSLALPDKKQQENVSSEEIFVAVEKVLGLLEMMTKRRDSNLH